MSLTKPASRDNGRTSNALSLHRSQSSRSPSTNTHSKATLEGILTPQQYKEAISFHANQTARQSPYPGQNFDDLALLLQHPNPIRPSPQTPNSWNQPLATLYTLEHDPNTTTQTSNNQNIVRKADHLFAPTELTKHLRSANSSQANHESLKSYMLFLSGYPASDWLATLGSLCQVDPDQYQRHLRFSPRQRYFVNPSLPSAVESIITLRFITIGFRCSPLLGGIDHWRQEGAEAMKQYRHNLQLNRQNVSTGDSIVRHYSVYDEHYFSIEQELSISLNYFKKQWFVLLLSDTGKNLADSVAGPWLSSNDQENGMPNSQWKTSLLPTIRHRPKLALKSHKYTLNPEEQDPSLDLPQVSSIVHRDYGKFLDWSLMKIDPFYALHELFEVSASSELQCLNLIEDKLGPETGYDILSKNCFSLSNLLYNLDILQIHIQRLRENIEKIKCRGSHQWPRAPDDTDLGKKAKDAASQLHRDYEFLLCKAQILASRCERGMGVIMNNANIAESKRAILQASRVHKITFLAFFYVPLSFTSSFFGMNFEQFSAGPTLGIWVWFVVSVPVMLLSFVFYKWDISAIMPRGSQVGRRLQKYWRNLW